MLPGCRCEKKNFLDFLEILKKMYYVSIYARQRKSFYLN